jgi:hypothetical protein
MTTVEIAATWAGNEPGVSVNFTDGAIAQALPPPGLPAHYITPLSASVSGAVNDTSTQNSTLHNNTSSSTGMPGAGSSARGAQASLPVSMNGSVSLDPAALAAAQTWLACTNDWHLKPGVCALLARVDWVGVNLHPFFKGLPVACDGLDIPGCYDGASWVVQRANQLKDQLRAKVGAPV